MAEKEAADKERNKDTIAAFMAFIKQGILVNTIGLACIIVLQVMWKLMNTIPHSWISQEIY